MKYIWKAHYLIKSKVMKNLSKFQRGSFMFTLFKKQKKWKNKMFKPSKSSKLFEQLALKKKRKHKVNGSRK